jgi:hypothetical protein
MAAVLRRRLTPSQLPIYNLQFTVDLWNIEAELIPFHAETSQLNLEVQKPHSEFFLLITFAEAEVQCVQT